MPFAFGVDEVGMPNDEARARLDKALEVAWHISVEKQILGKGMKVIIFLGANMPERTEKYGISSLAESAKLYLVSKGWPEDKIVMNPKGYNTMVEIMALREHLQDSTEVYSRLHFISSWMHIPRVYAICKTIFGFHARMKFHASSTPLRGRTLAYFLLREAVALPHSVCMAWRAVTASRCPVMEE